MVHLQLLVLVLGILHPQGRVVEGGQATDDLLAYLSGSLDAGVPRSSLPENNLLERLSANEWLFALLAALVLNLPLLLFSSFFIDRRRFAVTFAALVNSRELFTGLLLSSGWPLQLKMLNAAPLKTILRLRRPPMTQSQVTRLLAVFEQYERNLEEQDNPTVLFWLRFKLTIQEQNFATALLRVPLYSDYELTTMVRRARAKLHFIEKLEQQPKMNQRGRRPQSSTTISAVSSVSERQQSKFEEIWTKLEASVKNQVDPNPPPLKNPIQ